MEGAGGELALEQELLRLGFWDGGGGGGGGGGRRRRRGDEAIGQVAFEKARLARAVQGIGA